MLKFIQENKALIFLLSIVLISIIILSSFLVHYLKNNQKVVQVNPIEYAKDEDGNNLEQLHNDYIPQIKEPFTEESDYQSVGDLVFENPITYEKSTNPGTGATLYAAANEVALINSYGGLYLYDLQKDEPYVVDKFVTHGNLDPHNKYVFYTKYNDPVLKEQSTQKLYVMETKLNERKPAGDLEKGLTVKNSVYFNGLFIYVATDLAETRYFTGLVKAEQNLSPAIVSKFHSLISRQNFVEFKVFNGKLYGYDKTKKTIFKLENDNWIKVSDVPTPYLLDFSVSDDKVFINYTDLKGVYSSINGKIFENLSNSISTEWLDNNNLLINLDSNLHVFNYNENKLEPLVHNANNVFTDLRRIYYQSTDNTLIKQINILNR